MNSIVFYEYDGFVLDDKITSKTKELPLNDYQLETLFDLINTENSLFSKIFSLKGNTIKATQYVGAIKFDNLQFIILPKISKSTDSQFELNNINFMLEKAYGIKTHQIPTVSLSSMNGDFIEYQITYFVEKLINEIKRGVFNEFHKVESDKKFLKGKLNLSKTIRNSFKGKNTFVTSSIVLTEDNSINRILKWAIVELLSLTTISNSKSKLQYCLDTLADVRDIIPNESSFLNISYNRNNERFRDLINLAKLIFDGEQLVLADGEYSANGIVFDMNKLFEKFIASSIKESLPKIIKLDEQNEYILATQMNGSQKVKIKPDIVLSYLNTLVVIDTKYKIISEEAEDNLVSNQDFYQLTTYKSFFEKQFERVKALIVYPKFETDIETKFITTEGNESLEILTFSLSGNLKDNYKSICTQMFTKVSKYFLDNEIQVETHATL